MNTADAAKKLGYTAPYVTQLIRQRKLDAKRRGPRSWDVNPKSIEKFISIHEEIGRSWLLTGSTPEIPAEIVKIIEELEEEHIVINDKRLSIAELFQGLGQYFLAGIQPGSIFPPLAMTLPATNEDNGEIANEAYRKLMNGLRTLELVHDENRQTGRKGYTVTVTTDLGAKVIRALQSKDRSNP
jgi:hypothetical protein